MQFLFFTQAARKIECSHKDFSYLQQKILNPMIKNSAIRIKPQKSLHIIIIKSIPIAKQNKAKPTIRFILPPKKAYITNNICLLSFVLHSSFQYGYSFSLFTEFPKISSISFSAAFTASSSFGASVSSSMLSFFAVNLFTKSGTISKIFVIPS